MQLYLYDYNSSSDIDNILSWEPNQEQWWITGFNPQYEGTVDVKKQVMIGSIDFTGRDNMYEAFIEYITHSSDGKYVVYDEKGESKVIWICWYCEK